jgi:hypothetical protein
MVQKSGWMWISLVLLCGVVLASYCSVYYYQESLKYQQLYGDALKELRQFKTHMLVSILIDYRNGTKEWYNDTSVPIGTTLFNATREVAKVNYTIYSFGAFVNAINGKGGDPGHYWLWYNWNSTSNQWEMGMVGAGAFILHHGDIVSWVYEKSPW